MGSSALIHGLKTIIMRIIDFLPGSPFVYLEQSGGIYKFMRWFNWIIPVDWMIETLILAVLVINAFFVVQVPLRFFKVIE